MNNAIYLDYNATTPVDPEVIEAMLPFFNDVYGNPSSTHSFGQRADEAVEVAREKIACLINAHPSEIYFTSSATEALNLALKGCHLTADKQKNQIIISATEHKAVMDTCQFLTNKGTPVSVLPVNNNGHINTAQLNSIIGDQTLMAAVMYANNETGDLQPVQYIGQITKDRGVIYLCDATQAVGKLPVDVKADGIDMLAFSAHKLHGPKGIGALYVNKDISNITMKPFIHGGGHEKGLRSGTLNVPGIVGFGKACELTDNMLRVKSRSISILSQKLEAELLSIEGAMLNGHKKLRLPNTINISIKEIEGQMLQEALSNELAFSTGSACSSANPEPSHVLKAMGLPPNRISGSIRLSLGKNTTEKEVDHAAKKIKEAVKKLRNY